MKKILFFVIMVVAITVEAQVNIANGLLAYYPYNGNANDESGNGYNGTVNGATLTTDRFGNANKAYSFNSNTITSNLQQDPYSDFTLNFWFKTNGNNNDDISRNNFSNQNLKVLKDRPYNKYHLKKS